LPGNKITIKDIAQKAGVSISTVSRVLNDKPDVDDQTKEAIKKVIEELNYQPDNIARSMVLDKTFSIGLVIPNITNPFFPEVARGIEDAAQDKSYSVIFSNTDSKIKKEKEAVDLLLQNRVDGLILSISMENNDIIFELENKDFPVIQLDRNVPDSIYPSVMIDNKSSAYKATNYLLKKGYKKIAHISGPQNTFPGLQRKIGYKKALKENNMGYIKVCKGDFRKKSGYECTEKLLNDTKSPEIIFAANDMMALGAYNACKEKGYKIPDDIAIMGHDNIGISDLVEPPLTTMDQPKYELGTIAFEKLLKFINLNSKNEHLNPEQYPESQTLFTNLVDRESTKNNNLRKG